ncbi:hypothetical protein E1B28_013226 [Marasmius oreades]|uniref:Uncharacterized protein n=1 Tax=Marasmius oreades TaxID=181124 RepID=A0A9P7UMT1_9AGAR|nr:uncharacterized protein E1B28_013226 [Marasmius oreades]KAG7087245.1 hypothetical protein E1B28_013226 [Marasmius oreades]
MSSGSNSDRSYYIYQNTFGFPDPTQDSGSDRHPSELGLLTDPESDGTGRGPLYRRHPTRRGLVDLGFPDAQRAYIPSSRSEQLRLGFYGNNHFGSTGAYPTSQNGPNHNAAPTGFTNAHPGSHRPSSYSQQFPPHNHAGNNVSYSAGGTHARTGSGSSHGSGYEAGGESDHSGEETANTSPPGRSVNAPNQPAVGRARGHRRNPMGSVFGVEQYDQINQASSNSTLNPMSEVSQASFWICEYCRERIYGTVTTSHYDECQWFNRVE